MIIGLCYNYFCRPQRGAPSPSLYNHFSFNACTTEFRTTLAACKRSSCCQSMTMGSKPAPLFQLWPNLKLQAYASQAVTQKQCGSTLLGVHCPQIGELSFLFPPTVPSPRCCFRSFVFVECVLACAAKFMLACAAKQKSATPQSTGSQNLMNSKS